LILTRTLSEVNIEHNISANTHLPVSASQIGSRLKAAREKAGLTQEVAAAKLGVHVVTVSRWETAGVQARSDTLVRLAELYGTSVDALVSDPHVQGGQHSVDVSRGTNAKSRLARNLPLAIREYLAELQLRLTKGGATEDEISEAMDLLRSPAVFTFYKGGELSEFNEADVLRGMKAMAEGAIIPELRERGRKIR
jgi:transcriptional regulator with XRE-family HTH domain